MVSGVLCCLSCLLFSLSHSATIVVEIATAWRRYRLMDMERKRVTRRVMVCWCVSVNVVMVSVGIRAGDWRMDNIFPKFKFVVMS